MNGRNKNIDDLIVGSSELGDYAEAEDVDSKLLLPKYKHLYDRNSVYFTGTYSGEKVKQILREEAKNWILDTKDAYLDYSRASKEGDEYSAAYCKGAMDILMQFFDLIEEDLEC